MLEGSGIVLAHLVAVHPESVGTLFPEKDPSAIQDNLVLALGLPDDIVVNLGPTKPKYLLIQGESGEGELRWYSCPHTLSMLPPSSISKEPSKV